jgi:uncharacterized Zn finger protein (UPF0148 family)
MNCQKCGAVVDVGSDFCAECGTKIEGQIEITKIQEQQENNPVQEQQKNGPVAALKEEKKIRKINSRILIIIAAAVIWVLIILFILIQSVFLKANILKSTLEAGDTIKVSDIVEPKYGFTELQFADSAVDTNVLGKISVPYTFRCLGISKSRALEIEVADTKAPVIDGPDSLIVTDISSVNWSEKYSVNDFVQNLKEKITLEGDVPSSEGEHEVTLTVKDESGNVGTKKIKVEIIKATKDEEVALKLIEALVDKKGYKKEDITKLRMYSTDNSSYFAEVNGSDTYYYSAKDGDLYTFEAAALIAGYYSERSTFKIMLALLLEDMDMTRINKLMQ